jgi:hypothetical protein
MNKPVIGGFFVFMVIITCLIVSAVAAEFTFTMLKLELY